MATAFNLLRRDDVSRQATPTNPITATYTFNGAGVGQANTGSLYAAITEFHTARTQGSATLFTTTVAQQLYATLRTSINGQATSATMTTAIFDVMAAKDNPTAGTQTKIELDLLLDALRRTKLVRDEVDRVAGITNVGPGEDPVEVALGLIDAVKLDYQLAVLTAAKDTSPWRTD